MSMCKISRRNVFSRSFLFFVDQLTTRISTLSLHDALPIYQPTAKIQRNTEQQIGPLLFFQQPFQQFAAVMLEEQKRTNLLRSEEHTSELQSRQYIVCRLLLGKKKSKKAKFLGANYSSKMLL